VTRAATAAAVFLLAACLFSATAGEIVKFKNGHQMVVRKSKIEGDTILLTLDDGSILGFPKDLVTIEGNAYVDRYVPPSSPNRVSRGPTGAQLQGRRAGTGNMISSQTISTGELNGRSVMMGYNRPGAGRIAADDLGPQKAQQKAGGTFREARNRQQGEARARAGKPGQGSGEVPAPEIPKVRPTFVDDKKSATEPK
jgi:hypothetical protein